MGLGSLTTAEEWRRVQTSGKSGSCEHLRVRLLARETTAPSRLGLRIRGTGSARAVNRNRARRRVKEAFRLIGPPTGWDVVIHGASDLNDKSFEELGECLQRALRDAMSKTGAS